EERGGKLVVLGVVAGGPAELAGLRRGDALTAVEGVPVARSDDYDRSARRFRRGEPVRFLVEREGKTLELVVRPGVEVNALALALNLGGVVAYFLVAVLVLMAPQHDPRRSLLSTFSVAVALELALPRFPFGPPILDQGRQMAFFLLTGWQMALELRLASLIPRRAKWLVARPSLEKKITALGLGAGAAMALVAVGFREAPAPLGLPGTLDLFVLNFVVLPSWALAVVGILVRQVRDSGDPLSRQQGLLVLLGTLPWALYVTVTGVLQLFGMELPSWADYVQSLALLAFPLAVFVAVFRYHFLDFELLVRRSLVYTAITGSVLLIFYALVGAGSVLFSEWVGGTASLVLVAVAALVIGVVFAPLREFLQRLIDERFFPERYAQRQQLVQVAAELPALGKIQSMARFLVRRVAETFGCDRVTLLLADPGSGLLLASASTQLDPEEEFDSAFLMATNDPAVMAVAQAGTPMPAAVLAPLSGAMAQRLALFQAEVVLPVMAPRGLAGLLFLGAKDGGWGAEELELLALLGHHVGAVLENARLFEAATVDGLTGLLRRETVLEHLEREWQRAKRYNRPLAVGMADVDLFKPLNDRYGHLVGDAVLKWVAMTLAQALRSSDFLGRYGGEEFLLVLPETDTAGAKLVAEKLRQRIEDGVVRLEGGQTLKVTVSIGVAALDPHAARNPETPQELIDWADQALLQAKAEGRNRVKP
ncbi:MAG: diguanylate cyclase, partial [Thermoanaerobaculum sp.]